MQQNKGRFWIKVKLSRKYLWEKEIGGKRMRRQKMTNRGQHRQTDFMITLRLSKSLLIRTKRSIGHLKRSIRH
jgi:hypothetical protein